MVRRFRPPGGVAARGGTGGRFAGKLWAKSAPNLPQICRIWALLAESVGHEGGQNNWTLGYRRAGGDLYMLFHSQCPILLLGFLVVASLPTRAFSAAHYWAGRLQPYALSRISTPKSGRTGPKCCLARVRARRCSMVPHMTVVELKVARNRGGATYSSYRAQIPPPHQPYHVTC